MKGLAHTGRASQLETLRGEAEKLRGRLSLLSELGLRVSSSLDLSTVLQEVVDAACQLTDARYGALAVFDESGHVVDFKTHGVTHEERERIGAPPQGRGILGWLQHLQKPLRLRDLSRHPKSAGFPPHHPEMRTFLGAPIRHGEERLGNLYLTEKASGVEFDEDDEQILALFAAQAAMAIRNARLHQGVEQERQRLQLLIDTSPVGIIVIEGRDRRAALFNKELQRINGFEVKPGDSLDGYEPMMSFRRLDGSLYERKDRPLHRALERGETTRAEEMTFESPDGRKLPILYSAAPVYSGSGEITGAIAVIQDISPLEEIERLRGEFIGMISHELKTPLTAIKGSAATALGSSRPLDVQESLELFEIIDEQADRLRDLVDNLLDMTRIEAGKLSISPEPLDIHPMVQEAQETFARNGGSQDLDIQVPDDLPKIMADRRRIAQVLNNFLSNAGKFSPANMPITISVEPQDGKLVVSVTDRGRGIPRDRVSHLFKKFSQVHDDNRPKLAGSGLGLAISKGIVEAHGGRIWANSEGEGKGATFSFALPLATSAPEVGAPDASKRAEHLGRVHRPGERTRILVVDDDLQVTRLLQRSLNQAGYRPTVTSDPSQVITLIDSEEPDLVLLDILLPGASGFDLLKQIREFSGVPIIFLTARDHDEEMIRALRMGADDYMTKPFSPTELLARIEATLRRRVMPDVIEARQPYAYGDLSMNFAERRVTLKGQQVSLSATEYKLLYELATHAGRVLTHDQILQRVWGPEYSGETELVRSFVRNLRKKLGDDARSPRYIFTEPQVGYRMPKA